MIALACVGPGEKLRSAIQTLGRAGAQAFSRSSSPLFRWREGPRRRTQLRSVLSRLAAAAFALPLLSVVPAPAAGQQLPAAPAETLFVYGPGGPLPAMREAAAAFTRAHGVAVIVTAGPASQWLGRARADADVIYSGSEHMMTDFIGQLHEASAGAIVDSTVTPLYLRPAAILVRKGNPLGIARFEDLLKPGVKVLVVHGAGQTGLWEDVAGRTGNIEVVRAFRNNIGAFAPNSGEARRMWTGDASYDAWLIWNIWQVANPEIADMVPLAPEWLVYRDAGAALTRRGNDRPIAHAFVDYLQSPEGAAVFRRWGWR